MTAAKPDANGIRPMAHSIRIEAVPPSANKLKKMHFGETRKRRKAFFLKLLLGLADIGITPPFAAPKMRVQINVYSKGARARRLDTDNLWGGCKTMIDAMRDVGLIRNDSPKWLDLSVCEHREDGPFTVIEFESSIEPAKRAEKKNRRGEERWQKEKGLEPELPE